MPEPRRVCCGCQSAMHRVFARGVELDWCQFCGGVYFDRGELERVIGRPVAPSPGPEVARTCPGCGARLREEQLADQRVDACASCAGIYLDAGELDALAGKKVGLLPLPEEKAGEALTFKCVGCGEVLPLDEAYTMSEGLVCRTCAPGFAGHGFPGASVVAGGNVGNSGPALPLPGIDGFDAVANVAAVAVAPSPTTLLNAVASILGFFLS